MLWVGLKLWPILSICLLLAVGFTYLWTNAPIRHWHDSIQCDARLCIVWDEHHSSYKHVCTFCCTLRSQHCMNPFQYPYFRNSDSVTRSIMVYGGNPKFLLLPITAVLWIQLHLSSWYRKFRTYSRGLILYFMIYLTVNPGVWSLFYTSVLYRFQLNGLLVTALDRGCAITADAIVIVTTWWYTYASYKAQRHANLGPSLAQVMLYNGMHWTLQIGRDD